MHSCPWKLIDVECGLGVLVCISLEEGSFGWLRRAPFCRPATTITSQATVVVYLSTTKLLGTPKLRIHFRSIGISLAPRKPSTNRYWPR